MAFVCVVEFLVEEADAARAVPRRGGQSYAVGSTAGIDRAKLSGAGLSWPPTNARRDDAADPLDAAVVRVEQPGHGGCAVRDRSDASLLRQTVFVDTNRYKSMPLRTHPRQGTSL